ncbi:hypothetical protein QP423_07675 [Lactobacillus jensenii]|jgi:hypothetical protein|uniref:ImmA/IrrE family metallo-endopeptidase n=1 Tax=Lactobacillus jensenii TaxID=109790 RepID=A0ABU9FKF4_LACJE|nr:hypothetical protein [Lactobacillus jensenii]EEQ67864.1 hypothetical protein LBJG_00292 [Lactobacillus jensenii 1153]ERJ42113.1 repressor [Lactobacillus jensenii MD IIE-70(2)]MCT7875715.1 hypothetical protein [Lactobacillus iners]APT13889.1 hypothetical protein BUE77_00015 [Lactobacillus jensenii]EEQ24232.1 hypothetical protein LACJE0001_0085 [Lactobacillus jensenii 269-3]
MIDLINYLIKYAEKLGIGCLWFDGSPDNEPYSRLTLTNSKEIVMNINWKHAKAIPFEIGHLIGHLEHNDKHKDETLLKIERDKNEENAELYSVGLISGYVLKNKIEFNSYKDLFCYYGIPLRLLKCY